MHLFSPRQSPNEFVFALGLSKTFIFMQVFSPRQSPNEFVFALGLSKTVIFGFIAAKIVQAAGNAKFRCSRGCLFRIWRLGAYSFRFRIPLSFRPEHGSYRFSGRFGRVRALQSGKFCYLCTSQAVRRRAARSCRRGLHVRRGRQLNQYERSQKRLDGGARAFRT